MSDKIIIHIDGYKFDVTEYIKEHPGGSILALYNGKDATQAFNEIRSHCDSYVYDIMDKCCIGRVEKN
jgi:cytochrome b involved in lipid metabolism